MALELVRFAASLKAKTNMSNKQFYAVKISGDFETDIATDDNNAIGIVENNPKEGMAAAVGLEGISKISVKSGSSVVAGSGVSIDDGQASGTGSFGTCLESATGPCLVSIAFNQGPVDPTLTISADDDITADLFGKTVDDLQEDIEISNNAIAGTLKYIEDYSSAGYTGDEASGNFLALHFNLPTGATATVEVVNGVHGPQTLDPSDNICIFRISNKDTQKIKIVASLAGYRDTTKEYTLTGLTLNNA